MSNFENVPVLTKEQFMKSCEKAWNDTEAQGEQMVGVVMYMNCKGPIFQMTDGAFTEEAYVRMQKAIDRLIIFHRQRILKVYPNGDIPSSN